LKFEAIWNGGRGFGSGGLFLFSFGGGVPAGRDNADPFDRCGRWSFAHGGAELGVGFMGAIGGEFVTAEGVETRFERGDAKETPFGIGDGFRSTGWSLLRKHGLGEVLSVSFVGATFLVDESDEGLVGDDVVGGEEVVRPVCRF